MEIDGVTVSRYRAGEPVAAGYGSEILIVEVGTGGGPRGRGFATASSATAPILKALIETVIQPAILGADPRLTEHLWRRMHEAIPRRGKRRPRELRREQQRPEAARIRNPGVPVDVRVAADAVEHQDRKSTRLNSSH